MRTEIRLDSLVPHGIGGPDAGAINLIYEFLMNESGQNTYRYIHINQIGDELNELIIKQGKEIYINIRFPSPPDFESKTDIEKNLIRLEAINIGLVRIAEEYKKLDIQSLQTIKEKIVAKNFSFDFTYSTYKNKKNNDLNAKLIVHPQDKQFIYYLQIEIKDQIKCKLPIYKGFTSLYYVKDLFGIGKWKNDNYFILTGKRHDTEIHLTVDQCEIRYKNLTDYDKAPFFEMFRTDISPDERVKARENYESSLPPSVQAVIREDREN